MVIPIAFADGVIIDQPPPHQVPQNNFTQEGMAQIQRNDQEIKQLFDEIGTILNDIKQKYENIEFMLKNKEQIANCLAFESIKRDISDIESKISNAKQQKLDQAEIERLNTFNKIYNKSYTEFQINISKTGWNCQ